MGFLRLCGKVSGTLLLCIGIMFYIIHDASQNIVSGKIVDQLIEQMSDVMLSSLSSSGLHTEAIQQLTQYLPQNIEDEINEHVLDDKRAEIDAIKKQMLESDELQALSHTYLEAVLNGVIDGAAGMPDVNADAERLSNEYLPKLSQAVGITVNDDVMHQISKQLINKIDLQAALTGTVQKMNTTLSDQQKHALRIVRFLQSEAALYLAVACLVIGLVLIVACTKSAVKWSCYVGIAAILCGLVIFGAGKAAVILLQDNLQGHSGIIASFGEGIFDSICQNGIRLLLLGIGALGGFGLVKTIKKYMA